jgi:hypothetical protein
MSSLVSLLGFIAMYALPLAAVVPPILIGSSRTIILRTRILWAVFALCVGVPLLFVSAAGPWVLPRHWPVDARAFVAMGMFVAGIALPWVVYTIFRLRHASSAA